MINRTILLLCLACLIGTFFCDASAQSILCAIMGILGIFYCGYYIFVWMFCPIRRDWTLIQGKFLVKVLNFVLLIPFIITFCIQIGNGFEGGKPSQANPLYDPDQFTEAETPEVEEALEPSLFWTVFYYFLDPGNQHMSVSASGRRWAALTAILGVIFLNGMVISILVSWFDRRKEKWENGDIRYSSLALLRKKHAAVIGADETAALIVKDLLAGYGEKKIDYVFLLTDDDVRKVRDKISSYLTNDESRHLVVYNGQLDSIEEIYSLHLEKATEIYILGESSKEDVSHSYHDIQNMKCVHNIASCLSDKCVERKIVCHVLFEYQTTYSVFQFSDLPDNIREHLVFIPFSNYENWSQLVFVKNGYSESVRRVLPSSGRMDMKPGRVNDALHSAIRHIRGKMHKNNEQQRVITYRPLDGDGITPGSGDHVHLVVVGMSKMGIAIALQAAQIAHFPNFKPGPAPKDGKTFSRRTRITFIDTSADREMNFFKGRYQNLFDLSISRYADASAGGKIDDARWEDPLTEPGSAYSHFGENFIDIEWEFIKGNVEDPEVRDYLKDIALQAKPEEGHGNSILTVAVCLPLAHEAIAASIYMPGEIYDYAQQILVYQREASDIVYNLYFEEKTGSATVNKRYSKLRPFGMKYADLTMDRVYFRRAQLCNYVYELIFRKDIDDSVINDIIANIRDSTGKEAMKPVREAWKRLTIFNRWSNQYLANSFGTKLRSIGCADANYSLHSKLIKENVSRYRDPMAECEHNRWNGQQLLMGFRAYTAEEAAGYAMIGKDDTARRSAFKKAMKSRYEKAHLDICPFSLLDETDPDVKKYDMIFNNAIPEILGVTSHQHRQ